MPESARLTCPLCEEPPVQVFGPTQALCGNPACRALFWDPSLADGGLSDPQVVDLGWLSE